MTIQNPKRLLGKFTQLTTSLFRESLQDVYIYNAILKEVKRMQVLTTCQCDDCKEDKSGFLGEHKPYGDTGPKPNTGNSLGHVPIKTDFMSLVGQFATHYTAHSLGSFQ